MNGRTNDVNQQQAVEEMSEVPVKHFWSPAVSPWASSQVIAPLLSPAGHMWTMMVAPDSHDELGKGALLL